MDELKNISRLKKLESLREEEINETKRKRKNARQ